MKTKAIKRRRGVRPLPSQKRSRRSLRKSDGAQYFFFWLECPATGELHAVNATSDPDEVEWLVRKFMRIVQCPLRSGGPDPALIIRARRS